MAYLAEFLAIVLVSNLLTADLDILTLAAALIGVTSLIFAAKGNVWAQILMVVFSILYGIISFRFRYWGEMITYLRDDDADGGVVAITWFRIRRRATAVRLPYRN